VGDVLSRREVNPDERSRSMPLTIVATFQAKPEAAARLQEGLQALAVPTREEEGCISYRLYVDPEDPAAMVMVEQWADGAAIDAHNQSEHLQAFAKVAPELLAAPLSVDVLKPTKD
jgi:quinol monooxygenase YgiN